MSVQRIACPAHHAARQLLVGLQAHRLQEGLPDLSMATWPIQEVVCPQQVQNDCGVFTVLFARYAAARGTLLGFPFTAQHMAAALMLLFHELMRGNLVYWPQHP